MLTRLEHGQCDKGAGLMLCSFVLKLHEYDTLLLQYIGVLILYCISLGAFSGKYTDCKNMHGKNNIQFSNLLVAIGCSP